MMSPKTGRPKAEKPKVCTVRARLDEEKAEALKEYCKEQGINSADAVRQGLDLLLTSKK